MTYNIYWDNNLFGYSIFCEFTLCAFEEIEGTRTKIDLLASTKCLKIEICYEHFLTALTRLLSEIDGQYFVFKLLNALFKTQYQHSRNANFSRCSLKILNGCNLAVGTDKEVIT